MFKVNNKDTSTTLPRVSFLIKLQAWVRSPLIFTRNIFAWFFLHITTLDNKNYFRSRKINHNIGPSDYDLIFPKKKKKSNGNQANIYLFKVNNRNNRNRCKTCSKLTIKTSQWRQWRRFGVSTVNFESIWHFFWCFYCRLWTRKC